MITNARCGELFKSYFVMADKFPVQKITAAAFECYKDMMIRCNIIKGSMRAEKDQVVVVNYSMDGLAMLWNIALFALDKEIKEKALTFLVEIHVSLWREKKAELSIISRSFARTTMGLIHTDKPDRATVLDVLNIIKRFINQYLPITILRFEDFSYAKIDKAEYKGESYVIRKCTVKSPDGAIVRELSLKIKETMSIYDLRNAISYYLRKPKSHFRLITAVKKTVLDARFDNCLMKDASKMKIALKE